MATAESWDDEEPVPVSTAKPWVDGGEVCILPLQRLNDTEEEDQRRTVIKHIKEFKGEPVPADESFKQNWIVMEAELRSIMDAGLIPDDSVSSAGKW